MGRRVRLTFATGIVLILILRTAFFQTLSTRLDNVFLILLGALAILLLLPVERLKGLTLGPVAVTLAAPSGRRVRLSRPGRRRIASPPA